MRQEGTFKERGEVMSNARKVSEISLIDTGTSPHAKALFDMLP